MEPVCGLGGRLGGDECGLNKAWGAAGCRPHSMSQAPCSALSHVTSLSLTAPLGGKYSSPI